MDVVAFKDIFSVLITSGLVLALLAYSIYFLYRYGTSNHNYFSDQGIPGPKPLPFFGNTWGLWNQNLAEHDKRLIQKYGKIVGFYDGIRPNLYITHPELIRLIFIKDFDHFINRRSFGIEYSNNIRKMLVFIESQEWKNIRASVTPAFNTSKIKKMSGMMIECAEIFVDKLQNIVAKDGKMDVKKEVSEFTMNVIARSAFGIAIDNLGDEDDPFMKNAKMAFDQPFCRTPLRVIPFLYPQVVPQCAGVIRHLAQRLFLPIKQMNYFNSIVENVIRVRRQDKEKYHDFIEVSTSVIKKYKNENDQTMWNTTQVEEIVTAQCTLFLLAGFDTTKTGLSALLYQLSRHPVIQERLHNEILSKLEQFEEISHEMVLNFPYLDHIIHEVLRLYPPLPRIERECNQDVTYNGIHIKKGTLVTVPLNALHNDEEYYPDPDTFNPDRWSDSDRLSKMNPYVWLPFGSGPRNCVGMRFALEEMKLAVCTLVKKFRFFPVDETPEKLEFNKGYLMIGHLNEAIIGVALRD